MGWNSVTSSGVLLLGIFVTLVPAPTFEKIPQPPPPLSIIQQPGNSLNSGGGSCDVSGSPEGPSWSMPFVKLGNKRYYVGHFFKANWYRAHTYCRFHGMHLASIENKEENSVIEKYINEMGMGTEHFWTSGTDQADEGTFVWFGNGRPVGWENWNAGEPNNFKYENGEEEHCLELWNRDGKGLKWNDTPCSFETFFVCEV